MKIYNIGSHIHMGSMHKRVNRYLRFYALSAEVDFGDEFSYACYWLRKGRRLRNRVYKHKMLAHTNRICLRRLYT